jgi:uncharacterized protein HemY
MSNGVECSLPGSDDLIPLYVAGTMNEQELERFELHLLECAVCRGKVREGAAVRTVLHAVPSRRTRPLIWALPALAAAAAAAVILLPRENELARLGRTAAPPFTAEPVRAQSSAALADQGMAAYSAGDWARASELLARAAETDPTPGVYFFLGAALLMNDDAAGALAAFRNALEPEENPYAAEARFYSAKAWLRREQADSALAELAAIPADAGALHSHAGSLADTIRAVQR